MLLGVTGCDSSGGEAVVFENAPPGYYTYAVNVAEPTDIILFFVNMSEDPVHLVSIAIPGAGTAMRLISTSVYDTRRVGPAPATAAGILPLECPRYVPSPVTAITVPARSDTPWFGVVTIRFAKPGVYWLRRFRIDYTTPHGSGWQYLNDPVRLTVQEPALPGPKPEPPNQC